MPSLICPKCENIDPTWNHTNDEGEWVCCDVCQGKGYVDPLVAKRDVIKYLESLGFTVITEQKPQQCDLCGKVDELRPYGPNGEAICFECGKKDPETTEKKMGEYLG